MTSATCPRLFEVDALYDGRLVGSERARFERHLGSCAACASEVRAQQALADALRISTEVDTGEDDLRRRRERTRLLAAFDRSLLVPERRTRIRNLLCFASAAPVLIALLVFERGHLLSQSKTDPAPVAAAAREASVPKASIEAELGSVWSERTAGSRKQIQLDRGSLRVHVEHSVHSGKLVVVLPDGELEDIGTTFSVSAADGRTTQVSVEAGRVVLRVRGKPAVVLAAGQAWSLVPITAESSTLPSLPRPAATEVTSRSSLPVPAAVPDPSLEFRAATAALSAGDNPGAAAALASFLGKHPRDSHAEDAAYLLIIALQRSGDAGSMKRAARSYLLRYPAGFRHAEVERLVAVDAGP